DIQKITEPQLPELINLINNNETVKDSFEYNPESVFALNNIMKYIDNKFYEIVNDSIHFNLSDVKNFSAYDIHSSKKESLSNGTIYKKFNNKKLTFHEFVIVSAIANFYKSPYIKMINVE